MTKRLRAHFHAHLIGYLALFVALGGSAAALPGKGTIDRNDLRRNVVKTRNIRNDAATGAKVNEATLNFSCSAAKIEAAGLCFDSSDRPGNDWTNASDDCADEGGFLPGVAQYVTAVDKLGLSMPFPEFWTDARYEDIGASPTDRAMVFRTSTLTAFSDSAGDPNAYRCAFPLVR
jgi:hypothetical protein